MHVGNVFTSDVFYREDKSVVEADAAWGSRRGNGTTALYTIAARFGVNALTILTVSDHLLTGEDFFRGAANDV